INDEGMAKKNLTELRGNIRKDFKSIREGLTNEKKKEQINQLEKAWQGAHDERSSLQLLIQTRQFIDKEQAILQPLENNADEASRAMSGFVAGYLAIFVFTVVVMGGYLRRRIFHPLARLAEKMKHFTAGNHELPPQTDTQDEISDLESQFYN